MSNSDDPPKPARTLVGRPVPKFDPADPDAKAEEPAKLPGVPPQQQVVIPAGSDSTIPMGSSSMREALDAALAAGPTAAKASIDAARAAARTEPSASSTAPMGSKAIANAAAALPVASGKGALAATAKGSPPTARELAEAIAKAANESADRSASIAAGLASATPARNKPPTNPVGHSFAAPSVPDDSMFARPKTPTGPNPNAPFAPYTPGSNPAQPVPASGGYAQPGSNPAQNVVASGGYPQPGSNPAQPVPASGGYARPGSNPAQNVVASGGYPQPGSNPAQNVASGGYPQPGSNPAQNVVASGGYPQPGSNPAVNAPGYADQPRKAPTGPRPAVDPNAFAPAPASHDPSRGKPPTNPNVGTDPTAYNSPASYDPSRGRSPTGPNPGTDPTAYNPASYDPSRGKPPTNPNVGTDPTAYNSPASYDPSRGRSPTGPNPASYDPSRGKPPTNPNVGTDPTAYGAQPPPGADATAYARARPATAPNPLAQGYPSPVADARAKPPTGPNPAVDPNAFAAKPGSNPAAAAFDPSRPRPPTAPNPAVAHDPTMFNTPGQPFQPGYAAPSVTPMSPTDKTMMAAQAPVTTDGRPRIGTDPIRPITETLREVAVENYEITDEIARGGMGRILRARDVRLHRQVAIKELLGDNAHFKARFERETLITARLQHPAIVPIYDAGRWPTGELFYTMKLVAGKPLELLIDNVGGISERLRLLPNMIAVAEALAYAHTNNIVHRDLKPANILVGDFGETIVIDWGLAKDLTTNDAAEPAGPFRSPAVGAMGATVAGSVMGTPAYMPLEQGRGLQVDARADVYAIGAVLYHVLSKRAPYDGPDGMSILQALLKEPPPPLAAIAPDVPPELQAIVAKAMAREPEGRYPTCRELVDDLRRYQNGQMVGVHRYTSRELFKRWAKKHKGALAVAALSFVVLVVVGVIAISGVVSANREAQRERDIALEQSKAALDARAAAEVSEARAKKSEQQAASDRDRQRFARERRVEFNHFEHTQRRKCAECHPTDPKTFTALAGHPGHAECQGCHDEKSMEGLSNDPKCAFCHIDRVATTKDHTSLRACDDAGVRALKSAGGKVAPCFPHDLKQHRFDDANKPLDCTTCHAVLADMTKWGGKKYVSLQDLDTHTIIGQGPAGGVDAMHKACSTGCHAHEAQTGQGPGETNCSMCHPKRSADTF